MKTKLFKFAVVSAFVSTASLGIAMDDMTNVLPHAKPGECYAKVVIPAQYRTESSTVVVKDASEQVNSCYFRYRKADI